MEAIADYEIAVASNRNWAAAIGFLGGSRLLAGLMDGVIAAEEQAIRLSPRDPNLWIFYLYIGMTHLLQLRFNDAIFWLEKSRACHLEVATPNSFLAAAYALTGESGRAGFHLAEARRLSGGRHFSIARIRTNCAFSVPEVAALLDRTYLAGLIKAGVPET